LIGSFRADRHGDIARDEPSRPDCPKWLSVSAREHWPELVTLLHGLNVMADRHTVALALFTDALADWQKWMKQCDTGKPCDGLLKQKASAWDRVSKMLREFGMTPGSLSLVKSLRAVPSPARFPGFGAKMNHVGAKPVEME
jgi:phage terminase small subunit